MRAWRFALIGVSAVVLFACGQPAQQEASTESGPPVEETLAEDEPVELPPVDPALVGAPSTAFTAIEPSEVGVFGAPTVMAALEPLLGGEVHEEGTASLSLTVHEEGDNAVADIVRAGMADDSVSAGHLRVEFRREPDGWFPTNAYRRSMCARGAQANQWTSGLCP